MGQNTANIGITSDDVVLVLIQWHNTKKKKKENKLRK